MKVEVELTLLGYPDEYLWMRTELPHITYIISYPPGRLSHARTQSEFETLLWKIQVCKSMTRLHFLMPFEIYKKDNACNILQKLANSGVIQNNLLMCSDLYRDFILLQNFQTECTRETRWIERALISSEDDGVSYFFKMLWPGQSELVQLIFHCDMVQCLWSPCTASSPWDWKLVP